MTCECTSTSECTRTYERTCKCDSTSTCGGAHWVQAPTRHPPAVLPQIQRLALSLPNLTCIPNTNSSCALAWDTVLPFYTRYLLTSLLILPSQQLLTFFLSCLPFRTSTLTMTLCLRVPQSSVGRLAPDLKSAAGPFGAQGHSAQNKKIGGDFNGNWGCRLLGSETLPP